MKQKLYSVFNTSKIFFIAFRSRSFVYKMPKYYVVRGVKIDAGSNGMKNAKLYYWNDTTFDDYNRTNKRWHGIAVSFLFF